METRNEAFGRIPKANQDRFSAARREIRVLLSIFSLALLLPLFLLVSIRFTQGTLSQFEWQLIIVILAILTIGIIGMYYLGMKHLQLSEERSNFVSAISHELKTPVTAIRMYAEMLSSGMSDNPEKEKSYLGYISSELDTAFVKRKGEIILRYL